MVTQVIPEEQPDIFQSAMHGGSVKAENDGSLRTKIDFGEFGTIITDESMAHGGSGEGPSPLQVVVGALCGCESVTFSRTAKEMGFRYSGIAYEAMFSLDIRGRRGDRSVRPHFQAVRVRAAVRTGESEERLRAVVEETEARCPVFNLLHDANVSFEMLWVRLTPE